MIASVADGDEAALRELYLRTGPKLHGICIRILHDKGDAEEALQEAYVSVWRRAASFDPARASAISWLAAIARNRAIDRLRSTRNMRGTRPVEEALEIADPAPDALSRLEDGEQGRRLTGCIDELEDKQSSAIRAAFFDGLTYSQLADRVSVPLGTMKSWIRRGLAQLKECLER